MIEHNIGLIYKPNPLKEERIDYNHRGRALMALTGAAVGIYISAPVVSVILLAESVRQLSLSITDNDLNI